MLELGSGLGLTGLVISKMCQPNKYIFSDCHEQVLQKLAANIILNYISCDHVSDTNWLDTALNSSSALSGISVYSEQKFLLCDMCRKASEMLFSLTYCEICEKYWSTVTTNRENRCDLHSSQLNINRKVQLSQVDWEDYNKEDILTTFNDVDTIVAAGKCLHIHTMTNVLQLHFNEFVSTFSLFII